MPRSTAVAIISKILDAAGQRGLAAPKTPSPVVRWLEVGDLVDIKSGYG
jgi:hypothetical protein